MVAKRRRSEEKAGTRSPAGDAMASPFDRSQLTGPHRLGKGVVGVSHSRVSFSCRGGLPKRCLALFQTPGDSGRVTHALGTRGIDVPPDLGGAAAGEFVVEQQFTRGLARSIVCPAVVSVQIDLPETTNRQDHRNIEFLGWRRYGGPAIPGRAWDDLKRT